MDDCIKKRGRPVVGSGKRTGIFIRLSEEELDTLRYCSEKSNMSQSDIIRDAVNEVVDNMLRRINMVDLNDYGNYYDDYYEYNDDTCN